MKGPPHIGFLIFSKVMTVLPICTPCLILVSSRLSLSSFTNVPNLDLLSKTKQSSPTLSILAWLRETEMSVMRISHSCPLPNLMPSAGTFWMTIMLLAFYEIPSSMRWWPGGFYIGKSSYSCLSFSMNRGYSSLQTSQ